MSTDDAREQRIREFVVAEVSMQILKLVDDSTLKDCAERATALSSALIAYCKLHNFDLHTAVTAFQKTWDTVTVGEVKLQ